MREKLEKNTPYKVGNEVKVYNRFDNEMKNEVFPFEKAQRSNDIAIDCSSEMFVAKGIPADLHGIE